MRRDIRSEPLEGLTVDLLLETLKSSTYRFALLVDCMKAIPSSTPPESVSEKLGEFARALDIDAVQVRVLEEWAHSLEVAAPSAPPSHERLLQAKRLESRLSAVGIPPDSLVAPPVGFSAGLPGLSRRALERVAEHVEAHLDRRLLLSELAEVAGVSVSHFKTLFRRSMQLSAHQYVMQRRVARARRLLSQGTAISIAALEAGFTDASHLSRWMRRLLGVTPSQISKGRGSANLPSEPPRRRPIVRDAGSAHPVPLSHVRGTQHCR